MKQCSERFSAVCRNFPQGTLPATAAAPAASTKALSRATLVSPTKSAALRNSATIPSVRYLSWLRSYAQAESTTIHESTVAVQWHDGLASEYSVMWLRLNCPSSLHESGQKLITPRDVDPTLSAVEVSLRVTWRIPAYVPVAWLISLMIICRQYRSGSLKSEYRCQ